VKLFLTVALLSIALLVLGSLVGLTAKDLRMTVELSQSEQAYYLAEAGLTRAKTYYETTPSWRGEWHQIPLGPGTYTVRLYDQVGTLQIESTGEVGKVKKTITRKL
jgi:hypothetical protein